MAESAKMEAPDSQEARARANPKRRRRTKQSDTQTGGARSVVDGWE